MWIRVNALAAISLMACATVAAQDSPLNTWFQRSDRAKAGQPHWITPLITVTPRLEQEFRSDFLIQQMATGNDLINFDGGKGLELIPTEHVELLLNLPPYLQHNNPRLHDGFGDVSFVGKYRLLAGPEEYGNYILTVFLGAAIPTGSYSNGARAGVITPTIAAGKGWGNFDFQSTLGVALPTSRVNTIGHAITFNTAFQYHLLEKLWPEVEINSTFWKDGTQDSKKQGFITPGLILGRFTLHRRLSLTCGAGFQTAVTHYHNYNHALVFTVRFPF